MKIVYLLTLFLLFELDAKAQKPSNIILMDSEWIARSKTLLKTESVKENIAMANTADSLYLLGQYESALYYYNKVKSAYYSIGTDIELIAIIGMAECYSELKQPEKCIAYSEMVLSMRQIKPLKIHRFVFPEYVFLVRHSAYISEFYAYQDLGDDFKSYSMLERGRAEAMYIDLPISEKVRSKCIKTFDDLIEKLK